MMPSKSKAQRRKMAVLHEEGKISESQWEDFKKLRKGAPERLKQKSKNKSRKRRK